MNKKAIFAISLVVFAAALFCVLRFWVLPAREKVTQANVDTQNDPLTHDISAIDAYRSPYLGDASNVTGLFRALPLHNLSMTFEIDGEAGKLTVRYQTSAQTLGMTEVRRALAYNAAASMASIDNLRILNCIFEDATWSVTRERVEELLGTPLSRLLQPTDWRQEVQEKLTDAAFVDAFFR